MEVETMACRVSKLIYKTAISLDEHSSVQQAAELMAQENVRSLIVTGNGRVVGIFTRRDLLRHVIGAARDPSTLSLGEACSRDLVSITHDSTCKKAMRKMRNRLCQSLVVYQGSKLLGLVSLTEVANAMADHAMTDRGGNTGVVVNLFGAATLVMALSFITMLVFQLPEMMQLAGQATVR
jgi:signal-transduction protein with cAMP-binding, CBS, and nucleotidyltransferase domain